MLLARSLLAYTSALKKVEYSKLHTRISMPSAQRIAPAMENGLTTSTKPPKANINPYRTNFMATLSG